MRARCLKFIQVIVVLASFASAPSYALSLPAFCRSRMAEIATSERERIINSDPELGGVATFLETLGLLAPQWTGRSSQEATPLGIAYRSTIKSLSRTSRAVAKLQKIIDDTRPRSATEIRQALARWMIESQIDLKLIWPDELTLLGEQFKKEGIIDPETELIESHGYIPDVFYARLVERGYFPIGDFHDLLNHLPLMTLPHAVEAYRSPVSLFIEISLLENHLQESAKNQTLDPLRLKVLRGAIGGISHAMRNDFRYLTFESVLVKQKSWGRTQLFLAGAQALWLGTLFDYRGPNPSLPTTDKIADHLFLEYTSDEPSLFPSTLPKREEFLKDTPELWRLAEKILKDMGLNADGNFKSIHERLKTHVEQTLNDLKVTVETAPWNSGPFQSKFLKALFKKLGADKNLDGMLDLENRFSVQEVSTELYHQYLQWIFHDEKADWVLIP